ncbi:DUF2325 domain-containing protein [Aquabacterium sp.]|uniref:DUF2325 domain-containing protein n=1 Tax=Aquabacterium sp. TaxID=1872578 RepID=UPI0035B2DB68
MRQLVTKAVGGKPLADDYEIHVGTVAECSARNRLSDVLQKDLEARYVLSVNHFKAAKDAQTVAAMWAEAMQKGDVPGAFWATLTHPRCDEALMEAVLRDMHMLQHQAGAAIRVDVHRFNELTKEHGVLMRELGRVQARCSRVISDKTREIDMLQTQLMQHRATAIRKDSHIEFLLQDMAALKAALPDYENTTRLRKRIDQLTTRQAELDAQNTALRQQLVEAQRVLSMRAKEDWVPVTPEPTLAASEIQPSNTVALKEKTILCVGGRNGNVANYRDAIEQAGGHFAHHDGGLEDNPCALDSVLAAADLVICQTGCISHNAYWRVKDFCKRTGKQCVFVENPSTSSLTRTLQHISVEDSPSQA